MAVATPHVIAKISTLQLGSKKSPILVVPGAPSYCFWPLQSLIATTTSNRVAMLPAQWCGCGGGRRLLRPHASRGLAFPISRGSIVAYRFTFQRARLFACGQLAFLPFCLLVMCITLR